MIVSEPILEEAARAWMDPYWQARFAAAIVDRTLTLLRQDAEIIPLTVMVSGVATHPEDDAVLATAASARADYLVTGDRQLRRPATVQGVEIVSPRQFLEIVDSAAREQSATP